MARRFYKYDPTWLDSLITGYDGEGASKDEVVKELKRWGLTDEALNYLNSLDNDAFQRAVAEYYKEDDADYSSTLSPMMANIWEAIEDFAYGKDYYLDTDQLLEHLNALSGAPVQPNAAAYRTAAEDAIAAENADILRGYDDALARRTQSYEDELSDIRSGYRDMRSDLLTRQNMQNAQLMDSMQSQLDKQRRNALEAGASAGIRLAGNINTLLSTQNKQSQQSIETSNQLAQMMLNQRSAERGARNSYDDYMQTDLSNRTALKLGTQGRVDAKYNSDYGTAMDAYSQNKTNWDNAYDYNPLRDSYYNYKQKSQYQGGTN